VVTVESFLASRPEFASAVGLLNLETHLAYAITKVDASIWKDKTDEAVELTLAHALSLSPFGQMAKLVSKTGETTYGKELQTLKEQVTCGLRYF
jgi:hypothetical protein